VNWVRRGLTPWDVGREEGEQDVGTCDEEDVGTCDEDEQGGMTADAEKDDETSQQEDA
jgi:hypothetical protein